MPAFTPAAWPWPLPALSAWLAAWVSFGALRWSGAPAAAAFATGLAAGLALAWPLAGGRRRAIAAGGFPLSALALGAASGLPAWAWAVAALLLLLAYPLRAWRDAPFFPTPADALNGLDRVIALPAGARVLDAGCGLGHGLAALRRVWPEARLEGVEWSRPLAAWAAWRRRDAVVRRGDMWAASWAGLDVLYVFQRPESMARVLDKARREMPGGWLVSLEFEAPGLKPAARLGSRPLWVYRIPRSISSEPRR